MWLASVQIGPVFQSCGHDEVILGLKISTFYQE